MTPAEQPPNLLRRDAAALFSELQSTANGAGGWGYYRGKASRIEPTCWGLLASNASPRVDATLHARFLAGLQQSSGWLAENASWPINIGFNALAAFTWCALPTLATSDERNRLLTALIASKGVQATNDPHAGQDNSLQGWSWIDATFSWVEPTAWGLLALKKARHAGMSSASADARIAEADRLMVDRACRQGGWNFGNSVALSQDLRAYVPTTALGLLAMQDRRNDPAVIRGLAFLEEHWAEEDSAPGVGLSLICLHAYGRPVDYLRTHLRDRVANIMAFGNLCGDAIACVALSLDRSPNAFRL